MFELKKFIGSFFQIIFYLGSWVYGWIKANGLNFGKGKVKKELDIIDHGKGLVEPEVEEIKYTEYGEPIVTAKNLYPLLKAIDCPDSSEEKIVQKSEKVEHILNVKHEHHPYHY